MKTYQIYDGEHSPIFEDLPLVEAKTGKDAINKHLAKSGRKYKMRRSAGNNAIFRATPIIEKDGRLIRDGNDIWYAKVYD